MNKEFYAGNRKSLYQKLEAGSLVVVFSGHAPIKTNDENYPFFTNRNFLYLTGIEQENIVLMTYVGEGQIEELCIFFHRCICRTLDRKTYKRRGSRRTFRNYELQICGSIPEIFPDNYFLAMLRKFILILTRFMKIRRQ